MRTNEQRKRLRKYLRTLKANYNRAYRELSEIFRIRKGCPLERALRHQRFNDASQLLRLGEQCLAELNHCYALRIAPHRPGDQVLVTTTMQGFDPDPRRYLVLDVEWRRGDSYIYEVHELTKSGTLHKGRYPHPLCPSSRLSIEHCDDLLADETRLRADSARRSTSALLETVLEKGDLSAFLPNTAAQANDHRPYPFWLRQR